MPRISSETSHPSADLRSELLTLAGEVIPPRMLVNQHSIGNSPLANQQLFLNYFTAKRTETITQASLMTGSTAAAATPTLIRFAVYSVAANGDLTLMNSTVNDTTLFSATFTVYTKAYSASFSKVAGQEYALGLLIVSAAAMPQLRGLQFPAAGLDGTENRRKPIINAIVTSQADLPSTFADASLGNPAGGSAVLYWRLT